MQQQQGYLCGKHRLQARYLTLEPDGTVKIQFAFEIAAGHDETEFPLKRGYERGKFG